MTRLSVQGVTKRFGGVTATGDVSFDVPAKGVTAVIGPNGAGKTTLFSLVSGFLTPDQGRILFEGEDIVGMRPDRLAAKGLVRTFQLVQLFPDLTTLDNVKVGQHLQTRSGLLAAVFRPGSTRREEATVSARARELLALVGLLDVADQPAKVLSYGQQRLLEVARALAAGPRLVLLDEPAAGLDAAESKRLAAVIRTIADQGVTVLLIEHDMSLVMNVADRVVVLDFGRKIAEGAPAEVRAHPAVIAAYLGGVEIADV